MQGNTKINRKIANFNKLAQTIPHPYTPPQLKKEAFYEHESPDEAPDEDPTDALWKLEMLRSEIMDTESSLPAESLWPYSAKIRFGIDSLFRRERAEEEISLVLIEWHRLRLFVVNRLTILLRFSKKPTTDITAKYDLDVFLGILWDELRALQSLEKSWTWAGKHEGVAWDDEIDGRLLRLCFDRMDEYHEDQADGVEMDVAKERLEALERDSVEDGWYNKIEDDDEEDFEALADTWEHFVGASDQDS
ncbi:hypothetical protein BJ508DRAFT_337080 [Ascobolus immersus RN42]|uniref:Uncharacterized protein n=1 Tax=Ascobolus immersus RN42 TaxID=1160509 RepID=A0A3N4HDH2_ASCIM|nr:hypothetical protein BJ508DRAFT_337080 [Ascobolus immersus RN42]